MAGYDISEKEKKEIFEIAKMLKNVPPQTRVLIKGFLLGMEYTERDFKERNMSRKEELIN